MTSRGMQVPESNIPEREMVGFRRQISSKVDYDYPNRIIETYRTLGLTVRPGPFDAQVVRQIIAAIRGGFPLSVIRIGDGEGGVMAFRAYPGTSNLDRHVLNATVAMMKDSFYVSELWMIILRDLLLLAVRQADIIGVAGFPASEHIGFIPRTERILRRLSHDIRGAVGGWRAIDIMIRFAEQGFLSGKTVANSRLYFSILNNLEELFSYAPRVICINDNVMVSHALREKWPDLEIQHIVTGQAEYANRDGTLVTPEFLYEVKKQLPENLQGCLCLVGAGIWAEIYCTWVRQRGGVAVDIGSGFDLLAGKMTRPVHRGVLGESGNRFALMARTGTERVSD